MNINSNEIAKNFSNIRMQKKKLKKTIKNEEGKDRLKESINKNIDNKYLKFYDINKKSFIFKANKKFRDKSEEEHNFHINYVSDFLSKIFKENDILLGPKKVSIISDIYLDDNKIIVEI